MKEINVMDTSKNYLKAILKEDDTATRNSYIEIDENMATYNLIQYLSSDDCNIENLCRICLTIDEHMVSLLSTKESELADMFTSLTSIQVYPGEGLPSQICLSCKNQVVSCYEFKEKCEKSNYILKSVLKGEMITKVESCDENTLSEIITSEENTLKSEIKDEFDDEKKKEELHQDIQYLEDITDITSNDDTLCIVQNVRNNKDRRDKEDINITITDSKTLLEEVVSKKKSNGKIQKLYICKFCPKKYLKAKSLKSHIKQTHGTASYPHSCGQCKESFMSEHDLRLHTALHSKDNIWTCNYCHKEFKARQMLRRHIQRHMESKRFSCETCGKPFVELSALRRHLRVHTGDPIEKKHVCHICDKRYSSAALLAAHVARHSGARPCVCAAPACGKAFASARLLASHRRVHTDRKPYQCLYCDKRFRHESTRNTHHRTHTGEKPYVCSVCGKTFIQNSNLTLHMRTHTGERPYSCAVCERKFSSGSSLKAHQHTHTGEKPYSCSICGKRFARMDLSAHMRHHTGERPFACSVCPKKFVTASRLRDHCRIHTGEKPFECALCTQKFSTKSHLVKHVKTHQTKNKKIEKRKVVIVQEVDCDQSPISDKFVFVDSTENNGDMKSEENTATADITISDNFNKDMDIVHEVPLEVTEELVLQDDSDIKTEVLVVDDNENNMDNYQSDNICLTSSGVNFINNDLNYGNDVNLVTVNEGEVSISASSAMLEGTTVKLYQLDQSLVQISSSGGQVTISKITSKMTANF